MRDDFEFDCGQNRSARRARGFTAPIPQKFIGFDTGMSALGQKQTSAHVRVMSALPPKVDIGTGHEQRETVFKLAAALTRQDQYLQPACAYRVIPEFGLPATQDGSH